MNTGQQPHTEVAAELTAPGSVAPDSVAHDAVTHDKVAEAARTVEEGMAHFHANRLDEALAAFERALTLHPHAAHAYNGIGRVYYHLGPPERAIDAYQRAIALDRHYVAAYYGLGILYAAQLGDYAAALAVFQAGLAANPDNAFLVACTGTIYARMGRIAEAMAALHAAMQLEPEQTFALSWLSIIALHQRRYDDVIAFCWREIAIEDSDEPRRKLGYVYAQLGRNDEALAQLEQAVAMAPQDYEARGALARVYRTVGRHQEADTHYALAHTQAMADDEYGQACFAAVSGNVTEALTLLETAVPAGQVQAGWIRIDPEFAFIQDEPRFQALIEGAR